MRYEVITERQADERYEELLNECYPVVRIGGLTFDPAEIVKTLDPIAYDIGLSEFYDSLVEEDVYVEGYTDDLKPTDEDEEE
jgi:hypothetical protein